MGPVAHPFGDPCACDGSGPPAPPAARLARAAGMARVTLPPHVGQQVAVMLTAAATAARHRPRATVARALRSTGADPHVTRAANALMAVLDRHPHATINEVRDTLGDPSRDAAFAALDAGGAAA